MKLLFASVLLCITNLITAQSCLPDGITFTTQESIDNFQTDYPGCTEIPGRISIQGEAIQNLLGLSSITSAGEVSIVFTSQLTSLEGLHNLQAAGVVTIYDNSGLVNLEGLNELDSVFNTLTVHLNENLENLEGLNSLKYIGGTANIRSLPKLENFSGFDSLTHTGGFYIHNNSSLQNLSGMARLSEVDGTAEIINNSSLVTLEGFENVIVINGSLRIKENGSLTSLTGLDILRWIYGYFTVFFNNAMTSLDGIDNILYIQFTMEIQNNALLTDLSALNNLQTVNQVTITQNNSLTSLGEFTKLNPASVLGGFSPISNPLLSDCATIPFCTYPEHQDKFHFLFNTTGCNSSDEVRAACLVGSHDPADDAGIILFPNPAVDLLEIRGLIPGQKVLVTIFDQKGILVEEQRLSEPSIDITSLHPGMYFLSLMSDDIRVFSKFIRL